MDLIASAEKQLGFIDIILNGIMKGDWDAWKHTQPAPGVVPMAHCINVYRAFFLSFKQERAGGIPTPDETVDIVWHSHMMRMKTYVQDCTQIVGRVLNHNDILMETILGTAVSNLQKLSEQKGMEELREDLERATSMLSEGKENSKNLSTEAWKRVPGYYYRDYYPQVVSGIVSNAKESTQLARVPSEILAHVGRFTRYIPHATPEYREEYVYAAKMAETAEMWEDMAEAMILVAKIGQPLSLEERNLFSVAFKNLVGQRRASYRILAGILEKEQSKGVEERKLRTCKTAIDRVREEIVEISAKVVNYTKEMNINTTEARVFFDKMLGDYYRYSAEIDIKPGERLSKYGDKEYFVKLATEAYARAKVTAVAELSATHPIRLGLVLNYSVFIYEVLNLPDQACIEAKQAFDDAISMLDCVCSEDSYKDSTVIMQLLRDNLTLWTSDVSQPFSSLLNSYSRLSPD